MFIANIYEVWTIKFEHQISEGTYHTIGPETEELHCFYCTTLNFERKNIIMSQKWSRKAPKSIDVYTEAILMLSFISIG